MTAAFVVLALVITMILLVAVVSAVNSLCRSEDPPVLDIVVAAMLWPITLLVFIGVKLGRWLK